MKKISLFLSISLLLLAFQSCKKSTLSKGLPVNIVPKNKFLVRSIIWKELADTARIGYNADSTIKNITYSSPDGQTSVSTYTHQNNLIKEISVSGSLYKQIFTNDVSGRVSVVADVLKDNGTYASSQQLNFTYNTDGTVSTLKYNQINEAGSHLIYTDTYEYDAQHRPVKITAVDNTGNKIITTIEAYSQNVIFDPLYFVEQVINEDYIINNYPVLSNLKQLPAIIKQTRFDSKNQPYIEKQQNIQYTITNSRLEKQITTVSYPKQPTANTTSTMIYTY